MVLSSLRIIFVLGVAVFSLSSWALDETESAAAFEIKKEYMKSRAEDFYVHLDELDKADAARRMGEGEMRKTRTFNIQEYEKAREGFVKARKQKPAEDPTAWEAELKLRQQEYEKTRKQFVQYQKELQKVLSRAGTISEEDELGIDIYGDETGE